MIPEIRAVHDPVYGAIYPDPLEWHLIQSWPMQRLKGIKQLGLVDRIFPGANHTRFEHSVGTMHVAGKIAVHLGLDLMDIRQIRSAALLHDIGHSALSHAVEGVLSRNPEIQPILSGKRIYHHEKFTEDIITSHSFGLDADRIVEEDFGSPERFFRDVALISSGGKHPLGQIVSGDLDADRIDFLLRDSHHCGVDLGLVDLDQIIQALTIRKGSLVLAGRGDYRSEMSKTAAESILIARSHHYNALIHHPQVQSMRAMLLLSLESTLERQDPEEARSNIILFFKEYVDLDLLRFIMDCGDSKAQEILKRINTAREYPLIARFDHRFLHPGIRMGLSTISRNGRMRKLFEDSLSKKYGVLVDLSVGSGVPRSMRTEDEGFLYDESALAAGLVKSLTRQISLSFFADASIHVSLDEIKDQTSKLLSFIRAESYLPIDGLLLLFYSLHKILSQRFGDRILVPRIRNITWLYRTVARLKEMGSEELAGFFDYTFHSEFGFPYSEKLFEDIQILVAMGMVYQDQRNYEHEGRWLQRYEYMLTAEGLKYAESAAFSYKQEAEMIEDQLRMEKHAIPYDRVSLLLRRYIDASI